MSWIDKILPPKFNAMRVHDAVFRKGSGLSVPPVNRFCIGQTLKATSRSAPSAITTCVFARVSDLITC